MIRTLNPFTGAVELTFDEFDSDTVENKIAATFSAAKRYRATSFEQRAAWLNATSNLLLERKIEYGKMITREMGKTLVSAIAEVEKCALCCRYYADNGAEILADKAVHSESSDASTKAWVSLQPLGVVLAVMPWNFPFWQAFRFAAPALMAGNAGLLKHASNVPQCALAIEALFHDAGFPEDVFQTLLISSQKVNSIILDSRIAAVTLTGSEGAGMAVASAAGGALKKAVLELGGSDPFIVMSTADIDKAAEVGVQARMVNNGQSCISAKRFIVHKAVKEQFEAAFVARVNALKVGDPMERTTDIGPLATRAIAEDLHQQVAKSIAMGAKAVAGGDRLSETGCFYRPTVLVDVPLDSPAAIEELFGPVAPIFEVDSMDAAIELANSSPYGLGSAAWTADPTEAVRFVNELEAGTVVINGMVASDPAMPFGGIKRSGFGRELADYGIREFVNVKTVKVSIGHETVKHETE